MKKRLSITASLGSNENVGSDTDNITLTPTTVAHHQSPETTIEPHAAATSRSKDRPIVVKVSLDLIHFRLWKILDHWKILDQ